MFIFQIHLKHSHKLVLIVIAPLCEQPSTKILWKSYYTSHQEVFNKLKEAFSRPLQLNIVNYAAIYFASVLFQMGENWEKRIIWYVSRRLWLPEQRYHSNEQKCYVLIWAMRWHQHYLRDTVLRQRPTLRHSFKDTKVKLLRWTVQLQKYDLKIIHCSYCPTRSLGDRESELPDTLSWDPDDIAVNLNESCDRLVPLLLVPLQRINHAIVRLTRLSPSHNHK